MLLTERIKMLAEPLNMTFASLERDAGIGRGTIRKWDTNCPSADKLLKVADLLHSSTDYLLTGKEPDCNVSQEDIEWLNLIHSLPRDAQLEFKGEMKGYLRRMRQEDPSDNELKQAK